MGKFDGILICSDWDGTLFNGREVPKISIDAIRYFQSEGGYFTICSGRQATFLKKHEHYVKPNTYALCYNGALICSLDDGDILREGFLDAEAFDILNIIVSRCEGIRTVNVAERGKDSHTHYTPEEYLTKYDTVRESVAYKITLTTESEEAALNIMKLFSTLNCDRYIAARSSYAYVEILRRDLAKGESVKLLKEHLGSKLLVCMGDFENDLAMFESADVSYAVGNAIDRVKNCADKITASVSDGAVAEVIADIEKRFCDRN